MLKNITKALQIIFKDKFLIVLAASLGLNFLALDYILLNQITTFKVLSSQNTQFYIWASIILSITTAILFGISSALLVYVFKKQKEHAKESAPSNFLGLLFGAIASGCPVCGAWLLPLLGIAGSLAVFPFQGLEIKIFAIILLALSIFQSSNIVLGICKPSEAKKRSNITIIVILALIALLFLLPNVPQKYKTKFQRTGVSAPTKKQITIEKQTTSETNLENLFDQVNPAKGFALNINYGNLGYRLVEDGVIDFDKFKAVYDRSDSPLTKEQLKIFTKEGQNKPIVINRENSYFLLNFFWAFGLANENPILTEGQIVKYGEGKVGSFASTGGWSIAKKPLAEFFAKSRLAPLTQKQQPLLQSVTENVYRPCCGNSTAFPDCNHGMALLGVMELMAANGATEKEMFEAAKYFSAFWFPSQALDVATYFMTTENKSFADIDSKTFVSQQFFSAKGWSQLKSKLNTLNSGQQQVAPQGGGGCGVESGAASQQRPVPQGGGGCGVESGGSAQSATQQRPVPQGGGGCGV